MEALLRKPERIKKFAQDNWAHTVMGTTAAVTMVLSVVFLDVAQSRYTAQEGRFFLGVSGLLFLVGLGQIALLMQATGTDKPRTGAKVTNRLLKPLTDARGDDQNGEVPEYIERAFAHVQLLPAFSVKAGSSVLVTDLLPDTFGWAAAFQLTLLRATPAYGIAPLDTVLWGEPNEQRCFAVYHAANGTLCVKRFSKVATMPVGSVPTANEGNFLTFAFLGDASDEPLRRKSD